jgi:DNA repair exonuclease SbcCD nuclease subunit
MAVLEAAGAVRLMKEAGPAFWLETPSGPVLVGASPDGFPIPSGWEKSGQEIVVWLTHHNIDFPDFNEKRVKMRELLGIDWVINGHIHRPQPTVTKGQTRWANPGNITRLTFNRATAERKPAASIWRPGAADLERLELPHKPFAEVFPDQELPEETPPEVVSDSGFLQGLERLRWRRTKEGAGLKEFLQANLNPERPETAVIWELYREVVDR